jgi:DNA-binding MarR family transcriptional regulator
VQPRQAVAQVVSELERDGHVERVPEPGDARAELICLAARGPAALRVMRASAQSLEREWEARLWEHELAGFRDTLTLLLDPLREPSGSGRSGSDRGRAVENRRPAWTGGRG